MTPSQFNKITLGLIVSSFVSICGIAQAGTVQNLARCQSQNAPADGGFDVSVTRSFVARVGEANQMKTIASLSANTIAGARLIKNYSVAEQRPRDMGGSLAFVGRGFTLSIHTDSRPVNEQFTASLEATLPNGSKLSDDMLCVLTGQEPVTNMINVKGDQALALFKLLDAAKATSLPVMDAIIYDIKDLSCSTTVTPRFVNCEMTDHNGRQLVMQRDDAGAMMKLLMKLGVKAKIFVDASQLNASEIRCNAGTFIGAPRGMTTSCVITTSAL